MKKPTKAERMDARIKLAQEGMRAAGIDPTHFSLGMQLPREYVDPPEIWDTLVRLFAYYVSLEPEVTDETVQHARLRLRDDLSTLSKVAREVLAELENKLHDPQTL